MREGGSVNVMRNVTEKLAIFREAWVHTAQQLASRPDSKDADMEVAEPGKTQSTKARRTLSRMVLSKHKQGKLFPTVKEGGALNPQYEASSAGPISIEWRNAAQSNKTIAGAANRAAKLKRKRAAAKATGGSSSSSSSSSSKKSRHSGQQEV